MLLQYKQLDRRQVEESPVIRTAEVSLEELLVRKLVDASMFEGVLYEHTSNAWEETEVVYLEPSEKHRSLLPQQTVRAYGYTIEYYDVSSGTSRLVTTQSFQGFAQLVTRLLDHYTVLVGRDYRLNYTILDEDRGVVLIFVEPE
ncbi:hypothetical protein LOK74_09625 [Brevibacillus humidisoli]|uniref:hypothetical protein n=1 Tax=Brevibacillus humidisoli TaxID=2895522 RepID=UPI001E570B78|nr:hypothetical protein [Brevibacillus humidisoli]UFJ42726.1 hypothetical protein LOK74_09625 [Brevibacillus humidisoli]